VAATRKIIPAGSSSRTGTQLLALADTGQFLALHR
jgi:hypothetical protein